MLEICGQSCNNGHCNGFAFSRYRLPRLKTHELEGLIEEKQFFSFCFREVKQKKDFPCALLYYLGHLIDNRIIDIVKAQMILEEGLVFFSEQNHLEKERESIRKNLSTSPSESPYGLDNELEKDDFNVEEFDDFEW